MKRSTKTNKTKKLPKPAQAVPTKAAADSSTADAAIQTSAAAEVLQTSKLWRRFRIRRRSGRTKRPSSMPKIASSFVLLKQSTDIMRRNWKIFAGITAIYLLTSAAFVQGFGSIDLNGIKEALGGTGSDYSPVASSVVLLSALAASVGSGGNSASAYQSVLLLMTSLAVIWALRRLKAGEHIRIRDAYYQGMYPLVPVLLVILFMGVQLLPLLIGAGLYGLVTVNGIAASVFEQLLWIVLFFALAVWSLYMITSSVIAIYIAALPDMAPVAALRSARELVRFRRWAVLRRILVLPIALFLVTVLVMLPVILLVTPAAPLLFYVLTALWIPLAHSYMYSLYRELLP